MVDNSWFVVAVMGIDHMERILVIVDHMGS